MSKKSNEVLPVDLGLYKFDLSAQSEQRYILTSIDIAAGVGGLKFDKLNVNLEVIAYFTARVALLDILAAGASPIQVAFSTSLAKKNCSHIIDGIEQVLDDWSIDLNNRITWSTEDNFKASQTAISIMITAIAESVKLKWLNISKGDNLFVVGEPLVGSEVLKNKGGIINSNDFESLINACSVKNIIPIGSGGAIDRIKSIQNKTDLTFNSLNKEIENKSAGPATAVLVITDQNKEYFKTIINKSTYYLGYFN